MVYGMVYSHTHFISSRLNIKASQYKDITIQKIIIVAVHISYRYINSWNDNVDMEIIKM